jgi:hypothetical protein
VTKRFLIPCAALLALAACGGAEGIGGPDEAAHGSFRFSHSAVGPVAAGTYDGEGEVSLSGSGQFTLGEWAFAQVSASANDPMLVIASQPSAGTTGRHDMVIMDLPRNVTAGATVPFNIDCGIGGPSACAEISVSFRLTPGGDNPDAGCNLLNGEVRITERSARRIKGTFSGSGQCFVVGSTQNPPVQVTNGSFDVPILSLTR